MPWHLHCKWYTFGKPAKGVLLMGFLGKLKKVFARAPAPSVEELRTVFKRRYQAFRKLLGGQQHGPATHERHGIGHVRQL